MSDEVEVSKTIKTASDGSVKIAVEKYNELLETIANQKVSIGNLNSRLTKALNEPPVINRTVVKTSEMLAQEHRVSGITLMGLGTSMVVCGALRFKAGMR